MMSYRTLPKGIWWWRSLVLGALNIGIFFALLFWQRTGSPVEWCYNRGNSTLLVVLLSWLLLGNATRWSCLPPE